MTVIWYAALGALLALGVAAGIVAWQIINGRPIRRRKR